MKQMLTVEDVMNICQVKESKAYKLMKQVNSEMEKEGYIVIRGRVNSKYLMKKLGIVLEEPVS
ncbi:transcriptional regulator [uncultured Ilyobacter sp.]|uniref:transcriptional regulator n=1 Tax=uncultured Ilyobacter sp. TaxID=544433 RepID=UPI002AA86FB8|nr:transcriptional regulator [uncultured Ilyobacter sp.]